MRRAQITELLVCLCVGLALLAADTGANTPAETSADDSHGSRLTAPKPLSPP